MSSRLSILRHLIPSNIGIRVKDITYVVVEPSSEARDSSRTQGRNREAASGRPLGACGVDRGERGRATPAAREIDSRTPTRNRAGGPWGIDRRGHGLCATSARIAGLLQIEDGEAALHDRGMAGITRQWAPDSPHGRLSLGSASPGRSPGMGPRRSVGRGLR